MKMNAKIYPDGGKTGFSVCMNPDGGKMNSDLRPDSKLKISVLISTYKRSAFLVRLLDSIKAQNYTNCEIIIVDDASADDTEGVISQYKADNPDLDIKYLVNEKNLGVSESKRRAYLNASGDIIIFVDDDDYYIEPSYFSSLAQLYEEHPDCLMTIASTIQYSEQEKKRKHLDLNTPEVLTSREYLNGFMGIYKKPLSVFAMSLNNAVLKTIHFEELQCFSDTSLFLFGLLGKGNVYTINKAVGIYSIHTGNMTGNTAPEFIVNNLDSKEDIYKRAVKAGLLDNPKEWHYRNMAITAAYHLVRSRKKEDKIVWKWMKEHLNRTDYYRFAVRVMKLRLRK